MKSRLMIVYGELYVVAQRFRFYPVEWGIFLFFVFLNRLVAQSVYRLRRETLGVRPIMHPQSSGMEGRAERMRFESGRIGLKHD